MTATAFGFGTMLVVRASFILAGGLVAVALMRRFSADLRHLVLTVAIGSTITLPLALAVAPRWSLAVLPPVAGTTTPTVAPAIARDGFAPRVAPRIEATLANAPANAPAASASRGETTTARDWPLLLVLAWVLGAALVAVRIVAGQVRLRGIAAAACDADASWNAPLRDERARLGVRAPVRLCISERATTPVTWGVLSPVILLPPSAADWLADRRRAVLRHELAHVARGDARAQWAGALLSILYWFHPLAWLTVRRLRAECESACDDRVLATGMPAGEYADHLLSVARMTPGGGRTAFIAMEMPRQSQIASRVFAVLDPSRRRRTLAPFARGSLSAAGVVTLLIVAACQMVPRGAGVHALTGARVVENGVALVTHEAAELARATQFELEAAPLAVTSGANAADADLRYVGDAVILSDGRIAALRMIDPGVLIFAADGRFERRIGRLGTQRGELMAPHGMILLPGDTLYVPDENNKRVNWIAPNGAIRIEPTTSLGAASLTRPRGVTPHSGILLGSAVLTHGLDNDSIARPAVSVVLAPPALADARTIANVPGFEMVRITSNYRGRKRAESVPLRFGRHASIAAWDTVIAVASGEHGYEIEQRDARGGVIGRVRIVRPRRAVTQPMRDAQIATELARLDGPHSEAFVDAGESHRQARENPFADSLPPYGEIHVTKNRTLWVVDAIAPGDSTWTATAFRSDGAIVGRLVAHAGSYPLFFGDDRVIVSSSDAAGRISLRVHRIVRRNAVR